MIDVENYFRKGYHSGPITDIILDTQNLDLHIAKIRKSSENRNQNLSSYWHCIHGEVGNQYSTKLLPHEIDERMIITKENGYDVDQQWWELDRSDLIDSTKFFRSRVEAFVAKIYPEVSIWLDNYHHQDMFTLYEPGDFSKLHRDGKNPGRLCVILIYLNDPAEYNDHGGKLIISDEGLYEEFLPIKGTYVMMDFTLFNIMHSVETVKDGFDRYTYVDFVSNITKMNNQPN